jgi:putative hydrolase of HD superfamily
MDKRSDYDWPAIFDFILEISHLKRIERKNTLPHTKRFENSAEHSWHLAMACWAISNHLPETYDTKVLLQLALIHDLGEIDGGDTYLYASTRDTAKVAEREGVERLHQLPGNTIDDLLPLWDIQEYSDSPEARLVRIIDRLLPFFYNIKTKGVNWQKHGVTAAMVRERHAFIATEMPTLHAWFEEHLDGAVQAGWIPA